MFTGGTPRGVEDGAGADDSEYEVIVVDENNSSVLADHDPISAASLKVYVVH
jgi:hypothetical protein